MSLVVVELCIALPLWDPVSRLDGRKGVKGHAG